MFLFQGITFVTGILIARGLGPERLGKYQLLISLTVFIVTFAKLGLDEGLAYLIPKYQVHDPDKVPTLIVYSIGVTAATASVLGLVICLSGPALETYAFRLDGFANDLWYALFLLPALMVLLMILAALRGLGRADLRAYVYYYLVATSFFIVIALLAKTGLSSASVYWARIGSYVAGAVVGVALILRNITPRTSVSISKKELKKIHSFAGLLVFAGLFQYMVEQPLIDLIIIGRTSSAHDTGLYSVASRVSMLVAISTNALMIAMGPVLAKKVATKDTSALQAEYLKASDWMARIGLFCGCGVLLLHGEVLALFGSEYSKSTQVLIILTLGQMIVSTLGLNTPLLLSSDKAKIEFFISGACAFFMAIFGLLLGIHFGPTGVAIATATTLSTMNTLRYLVVKKTTGVKLGRRYPEIIFIAIASISISLYAKHITSSTGAQTQLTLKTLAYALSYAALTYIFKEKISANKT